METGDGNPPGKPCGQEEERSVLNKGEIPLSEWMNAGSDPEKQEQEHSPAASAEQPRRPRRADRYRTENAESQATGEIPVRQKASKPALGSGSETAREVANRYRQRQAQAMPREAGQGRLRMEGAGQDAAGRQISREAGRIRPRPEGTGQYPGERPRPGNPQERVGYPSGRMGMNNAQRGRMSEAGRARLAEESRKGENAYGDRREGLDAGRRYPERPAFPERPRKRHGLLTALTLALLVIGIVLTVVLIMPESGPLGSLKQTVTGLLGTRKTVPPAARSFLLTGQDREEAPAEVSFFAVTDKGVEDMRLLDAEGQVLPADPLADSQENEIRWELTWYAEKPYTGSVFLQIQHAEEWLDTGLEAKVEVRVPREPEPEESPLPVVFATEEPTATPIPTQTRVPAQEEETPAEETGEDPDEDFGDGENEGLGENGPGAADPDDPEREILPEDPAEAEDEQADTDSAEDSGSPGSRSEAGAAVIAVARDGEAQAETAEENGEDGGNAEKENAGEAETGPVKQMLTASAAESADPSLIATSVIYNGTRKVVEYARSDKEKIHMPTLGEYTKQKIGVLTFRTDAFRQNAAVGNTEGTDSLEIAWTAEAGSIKGADQTYYGIGWVGQPAIVKWSKEVRELSEMYDSKKEKSGLKEVIVAGLDGRIYFLDLSDGTPTRNSIKLGFPMKGTPSVHPGGAPYMTVGQFARKMAGKTGTIGLRQYNLYMLKELSLIDGLDGKNNRPYNTVGSFETSALIDRTSKCMVTAGTNGMLYLINLNSEFDYQAGTYNQSPATVVMKTKAKGEKEASTAVEASIAMYDRYVYYADVGGFLRCVDTNTLTTVWAVALGDRVESTPALDWHGEDGLDLYAATELFTRKKGDAEVRCFNALTGEERWSASFGVKKDTTKNKTVSGFRASPVVGQEGLADYVYYTVNNLSSEGAEQLGAGSAQAALIALRKADGSVAWARGLSGRGYSSPVAVYDKQGNGAVIQCAGDGSVLLLDGKTGEEKASLQIDGAIEASPAVYDGIMVIGTTEKNKNNIYGIRIR